MPMADSKEKTTSVSVDQARSPCPVPLTPALEGATSHSSFLSLPPEILLEIANYFVDDYHFWNQKCFKNLRKRGIAQKFCPYYCLAYSHPYLYTLLLGRSVISNIRLWEERQRRMLHEKKIRRRDLKPSSADCIIMNEDFPKEMVRDRKSQTAQEE